MVVVHYRIYNKYSKGWILCLGKLIGGVPIPPHTEHYSHRGVQHCAPGQGQLILVLVLVLVCVLVQHSATGQGHLVLVLVCNTLHLGGPACTSPRSLGSCSGGTEKAQTGSMWWVVT